MRPSGSMRARRRFKSSNTRSSVASWGALASGVGVATMLISIAALPYWRLAAQIAFAIGASFTLAFAIWRTGILWRGGRDPGTPTPGLYLPTVGGAFRTATADPAHRYR